MISDESLIVLDRTKEVLSKIDEHKGEYQALLNMTKSNLSISKFVMSVPRYFFVFF